MNKTIFKDFSKYVSFNILGQIAYSCYTLADTFFVSADIGTNGLTALNLAFPVFCIISGTGLMLVLLFASIFLEKKEFFSFDNSESCSNEKNHWQHPCKWYSAISDGSRFRHRSFPYSAAFLF